MSTPPTSRITPLIALIVICALPELTLQGADWGYWGSARWRPAAYENGAFWAGLWRDWRPNYAAQPYLMFFTYAFLHAGFWHFLINMVTLVSIGRPVIDRIGEARFALLYLLTAIGGAVGFALLTSKFQPMVGASGALFGLVGAWVTWDLVDVHRARPGLRTLAWAVLWPVTLLTGLNLVMYWVAAGNLAWETHLGGTISGVLLAPLLDHKRR